MRLKLSIGNADPTDILDKIKKVYSYMTLVENDIDYENAHSDVTVEIKDEDLDMFLDLIKKGQENYDFDPLHTIYDMEDVVLWESSGF